VLHCQSLIFIDDNPKYFKKMLISLQYVKDQSTAHLQVPVMEEDQPPYFERMLEHNGVHDVICYSGPKIPSTNLFRDRTHCAYLGS